MAATLQVGGLLSTCSNPGAATPHSLWKLYKDQAAAAANPFTLRNQFQHPPRHPTSTPNGANAQVRAFEALATSANVSRQLCKSTAVQAAPQRNRVGVASQRRAGSPPRATLRTLAPAMGSALTPVSYTSTRPKPSSQQLGISSTSATTGTIALSMRSLTMGRG